MVNETLRHGNEANHLRTPSMLVWKMRTAEAVVINNDTAESERAQIHEWPDQLVPTMAIREPQIRLAMPIPKAQS